MQQRITESQRILLIAVMSSADPRSVKKVLNGGLVREVVRLRVEAANRELHALERELTKTQ
jgi:hypothetical protein